MISGVKAKLIGKRTRIISIRMAKRNGEWWIGTITIEMAKIKYLKIKGHFS